MRHPTSFLGRFDVDPCLNPAEIEWLRAYAQSPVFPAGTDPYVVPMNPKAARLGHEAGDAQESHCDWEPCLDGCCLLWKGGSETRDFGVDPQYIVDHFLRPGAHAASTGRADFQAFTFDHRVSGIVAAEDGETRELYLLVADDNVIEERTLVPGDPSPW